MKTPIVFLLIFSLAISSCIGRVVVDKTNEFKTSKSMYSFVQEYEVPSDIHLSLETVGGNIEVKGYEGSRVKVAFVVTKNSGEVIEMTLDELKKYASFVITKEGHELSIQVKEIFKRNWSVGFIVQTPQNTTCNLSTSGGNLVLSDLIGNQKANTSGGNISLDHLKGEMNACTSGGNISLDQLVGNTTVSTSGGNIHANNLTSDLRAETSGGNIHLQNHRGMADVSTSGGNISLSEMYGEVSASTSGGNVSADMKSLTKNLFLETNGGSINCELPSNLGLNIDLAASNIKTNLDNFKGTTSDEQITGTILGGGIPVKMFCPGGTIHLKFTKPD